jgi:hypothetical protein
MILAHNYWLTIVWIFGFLSFRVFGFLGLGNFCQKGRIQSSSVLYFGTSLVPKLSTFFTAYFADCVYNVFVIYQIMGWLVLQHNFSIG